MSDNLTQKILQQVQEKKLQPKPRWQFIAKQILIWLGVSLSIIIGALASSIIVFLSVNNDWEIYDSIDKNLIHFIVLSIPYFWLIILLAFIGLGYFYFRQTKRGYRYRLWQLIFVYIIGCFVIGGVAYAYGGSQEIDRLLTEKVPVYKNLVNQQTKRWTKPEAGLLSGEVEKIDPEKKEIIIEDSNDKSWKIDYSKTKEPILPPIKIGEKLRFIGKPEKDNDFMANRILENKPNLHFRPKERNINNINIKNRPK